MNKYLLLAVMLANVSGLCAEPVNFEDIKSSGDIVQVKDSDCLQDSELKQNKIKKIISAVMIISGFAGIALGVSSLNNNITIINDNKVVYKSLGFFMSMASIINGFVAIGSGIIDCKDVYNAKNA